MDGTIPTSGNGLWNMMASDHAPSEITSREDFATWEEGQKVERAAKKGSHELRIKMAWDWIVMGFTTLVLLASFLGLIGVWAWPGPVAPIHILTPIVSGWIGTQLRKKG